MALADNGRSEKSSNIYNTDVLTKILKEEGKDLFDARSASLGHTLQGGVPSPLDRTRAARLSLKCMQFLEKHATPNAQSAKGKKTYSKETAAMIAIRGSEIIYPTMDEVKAKADMKLRKGRDEWWRSIKDLAEVCRVSSHLEYQECADEQVMGGRSGLVVSDLVKDKVAPK